MTSTAALTNEVMTMAGRSLQSSTFYNITTAFSILNPLNFTVPAPTVQFSRPTLRFGYTTDFSYVMGTDDERTEYLSGLGWVGIFVASLFGLWLVIILILCCLGSRRVGFLSGTPFERKYYYVNTGQSVNFKDTNEQVEENTLANPYEVNTIPENSFEKKQKPTMSSDYRSDDEDVYIEGDSYENNSNIDNSNNHYQRQQSLRSSPPNRSESNIVPGSPHQTTSTTTGGGKFCCGVEQQNWIRGIYVISGIAFITFAILSVTQGLTNLQGTVDTMNGSANDIQNTTESGVNIINSLLGIRNQTKELRSTLQKELSNGSFCPAVPDVAADAVTSKISSLANTALEYVSQLDDYVSGDTLISLRSSLESSTKTANDVYNTTNDINLNDWESLVILIPFTIIPAILVAKVIMASYGTSIKWVNCAVTWIVHPLFIAMVIISAAGCAATAMIASANADFCYPSTYTTDPSSVLPEALGVSHVVNAPDVSVLRILQQQGYSLSSDEYKYISFYVLQCRDKNPFGTITQYVPVLSESQGSLDKLQSSLNASDVAAELSALCNRDFGPIVRSLQEMKDILNVGTTALFDTFRLLSCPHIVPIYQQTFYEGSCEYSVKAVVWLFSATLVMAFTGFLMLMFRSSLLETQYTYTYDSSYGRSSAFHDENDDYNGDAQTRAGYTTAGQDSVMNSVLNYEKGHLDGKN